jgi:ubiquinone/menaquinone biosynthesis C-methylase UbiE
MLEYAGKMGSTEWDKYWSNKKKKYLFSLFRKHVFARAVRYYTNRYFPKKGTFVEAGCGSGDTSILINKYKRKIIAMDFSEEALKSAKKNKKFDEFIQADIAKLPFKNDSIDGIWNLGVMEHFEKDEITKIINESYKKLKKDRCLIMFWATKITPYQICLDTYNRVFKQNFQLFPDEHNRLKSKKHAKNIMSKSNFINYKVFFSWRDLFTDIVIVAKK